MTEKDGSADPKAKEEILNINEEIKLLSNWRMQGLQLIAKRTHTLLFSQSMLLGAYGLIVFGDFVSDKTDRRFYATILALAGSIFAIMLGHSSHQYYRREWHKIDKRLEGLYSFFGEISKESEKRYLIPTWILSSMLSCMFISFWIVLITVLFGGWYISSLTISLLALANITLFIYWQQYEDDVT